MDGTTLQGILRFFFWTSVCLLPLLVVGALVYSTVVKLRQRSAHEELGKALGFHPLNRADNIQLVWYGGQIQGRNLAINTFTSTHSYYALERTRRGFDTKLRIAMGVRVKEPLGVIAYLNQNNKFPLSFEETFTLEQGQVSPAAREAMLAFAFRGHSIGLRRDLRVAFDRGIRDIRILDRASAQQGLLGDEILADSKTILVHDHPFADISPTELKTILDELSAVAEAIETDEVPPLLAGQTSPPTDTSSRNAYLLYIGLGVLGVPACLCICGMINSFVLSYR